MSTRSARSTCSTRRTGWRWSGEKTTRAERGGRAAAGEAGWARAAGRRGGSVIVSTLVSLHVFGEGTRGIVCEWACCLHWKAW